MCYPAVGEVGLVIFDLCLASCHDNIEKHEPTSFTHPPPFIKNLARKK
jgi:hypothetical protein